MASYDTAAPVPPGSEDDFPQRKFKPVHIAIVVIVSVFLLLLVGARWLSYKDHKRRRVAATPRPATQSIPRGPWNREVQQRESQAALCYEDWLRDVMKQDLKQPPQSPTKAQKTKSRRGLRVTSIRTIGTGETGDQQQDWSQARRSPQLKVVQSDSTRGLCQSVSPSWRNSSIDQISVMHDKEQADGIGLGVAMEFPKSQDSDESIDPILAEAHNSKDVTVSLRPLPDRKF